MGVTRNKMKTGIRALAQATGLSTATISRVLNNSDLVSPKTRERVRKAIEETGYRPNAPARALSTNRTRTVAAVIPTIEHSIFARFLAALEAALAEQRYGLIIATAGEDPELEEKRARELINLGAEAVVVSGAVHNEQLVRFLTSANIPVVCTSVNEAASLPAIGYDNAALAGQAVRYLARKGHVQIGIAHGPLTNNDRTRLRLAGATEAASEAGLAIETASVPLSVEGGVKAAQLMLTKHSRPVSAMLCLSDVLALGFIFEAERRQVRIPEDFSLMGFDDLDWAAVSSPPLTTIHLPTEEMGRHAATAIVRKLDEGVEIGNLLIDAEIVERGSVRTNKLA